jgi:hypothetical protein
MESLKSNDSWNRLDEENNSVVPPGLGLHGLGVPALKRWAKLGCPSGAGVLRLRERDSAAEAGIRRRGLVQRWAKLGCPSGAGVFATAERDLSG